MKKAKGCITIDDPNEKPKGYGAPHVQPILKSYPHKIWLTQGGFDLMEQLEKGKDSVTAAIVPNRERGGKIASMNRREAKIIVQMLKTQKMPTKINDQKIATEGLEWLVTNGWVINTTKLSGGTTFQKTTTGREIAKMTDKQLLKEMAGERGWIADKWEAMRGNFYFWIINAVLLATLTYLFRGSLIPFWNSLIPK